MAIDVAQAQRSKAAKAATGSTPRLPVMAMSGVRTLCQEFISG
jgi:hypothetical protein